MFHSLSVFATTDMHISFEDCKANPGGEVVVPVTIKNNSGIAAFRFKATYDADIFEFISAEKGSAMTDGTLKSSCNDDLGVVTFTWFSVNDISNDGVLVLLKFKVSDDAVGDYDIAVSYLVEDLLNDKLETVDCNVTSAKVTIGSNVSGRLNVSGSDGKPITVRLLKQNIEWDKKIIYDSAFCFKSVASGDYIIEASKDGYVSERTLVTVQTEDLTDIDIHLFMKGDINKTGEITDADAVYLLMHTFFVEDYPVDQPCDFDGDGSVTDADAVYLLMHTFFPEDYPIG